MCAAFSCLLSFFLTKKGCIYMEWFKNNSKLYNCIIKGPIRRRINMEFLKFKNSPFRIKDVCIVLKLSEMDYQNWRTKCLPKIFKWFYPYFVLFNCQIYILECESAKIVWYDYRIIIYHSVSVQLIDWDNFYLYPAQSCNYRGTVTES